MISGFLDVSWSPKFNIINDLWRHQDTSNKPKKKLPNYSNILFGKSPNFGTHKMKLLEIAGAGRS